MNAAFSQWIEQCGLQSKRSLKDHLRKNHNVENNDKVYQCGHCDISFTRSCNLLRHLRSQHLSLKSDRCFSCPTYFRSPAPLGDHQELHHSSLPSTSVSFNNVCDLIDFSTEAMKTPSAKVRRLRCSGTLQLPRFSKREYHSFRGFFVEVYAQAKIGPNCLCEARNTLGKKTTEALLKSPRGKKSCKISDDEYMQHMDALKTQLNVFATGGSGWGVNTLSRLEIKTICCNNVLW